jgi:hypothetical protein
VPLATWFAGPLRAQVESTILASNAACLGHLDRALLKSAWNDFLNGTWDGARTIYALWLYESWSDNLAA